MKKIYMLIAVTLVSAGLLLSFSSSLQAQTCPVGKVFRTTGYGPAGEVVSTVYVEGCQPNGFMHYGAILFQYLVLKLPRR